MSQSIEPMRIKLSLLRRITSIRNGLSCDVAATVTQIQELEKQIAEAEALLDQAEPVTQPKKKRGRPRKSAAISETVIAVPPVVPASVDNEDEEQEEEENIGVQPVTPAGPRAGGFLDE